MKRRSSILKLPKNDATIEVTQELKQRRLSKRVSFAETCQIKPFEIIRKIGKDGSEGLVCESSSKNNDQSSPGPLSQKIPTNEAVVNETNKENVAFQFGQQNQSPAFLQSDSQQGHSNSLDSTYEVPIKDYSGCTIDPYGTLNPSIRGISLDTTIIEEDTEGDSVQKPQKKISRKVIAPSNSKKRSIKSNNQALQASSKKAKINLEDVSYTCSNQTAEKLAALLSKKKFLKAYIEPQENIEQTSTETKRAKIDPTGFLKAYSDDIEKPKKPEVERKSVKVNPTGFLQAYSEDLQKQKKTNSEAKSVKVDPSGFLKAFADDMEKKKKSSETKLVKVDATGFLKNYSDELEKKKKIGGDPKSAKVDPTGFLKAYSEDLEKKKKKSAETKSIKIDATGFLKAYSEDLEKLKQTSTERKSVEIIPENQANKSIIEDVENQTFTKTIRFSEAMNITTCDQDISKAEGSNNSILPVEDDNMRKQDKLFNRTTRASEIMDITTCALPKVVDVKKAALNKTVRLSETMNLTTCGHGTLQTKSLEEDTTLTFEDDAASKGENILKRKTNTSEITDITTHDNDSSKDEVFKKPAVNKTVRLSEMMNLTCVDYESQTSEDNISRKQVNKTTRASEIMDITICGFNLPKDEDLTKSTSNKTVRQSEIMNLTNCDHDLSPVDNEKTILSEEIVNISFAEENVEKQTGERLNKTTRRSEFMELTSCVTDLPNFDNLKKPISNKTERQSEMMNLTTCDHDLSPEDNEKTILSEEIDISFAEKNVEKQTGERLNKTTRRSEFMELTTCVTDLPKFDNFKKPISNKTVRQSEMMNLTTCDHDLSPEDNEKTILSEEIDNISFAEDNVEKQAGERLNKTTRRSEFMELTTCVTDLPKFDNFKKLISNKTVRQSEMMNLTTCDHNLCPEDNEKTIISEEVDNISFAEDIVGKQTGEQFNKTSRRSEFMELTTCVTDLPNFEDFKNPTSNKTVRLSEMMNITCELDLSPEDNNKTILSEEANHSIAEDIVEKQGGKLNKTSRVSEIMKLTTCVADLSNFEDFKKPTSNKTVRQSEMMNLTICDHDSEDDNKTIFSEEADNINNTVANQVNTTTRVSEMMESTKAADLSKFEDLKQPTLNKTVRLSEMMNLTTCEPDLSPESNNKIILSDEAMNMTIQDHISNKTIRMSEIMNLTACDRTSLQSSEEDNISIKKTGDTILISAERGPTICDDILKTKDSDNINQTVNRNESLNITPIENNINRTSRASEIMNITVCDINLPDIKSPLEEFKPTSAAEVLQLSQKKKKNCKDERSNGRDSFR